MSYFEIGLLISLVIFYHKISEIKVGLDTLHNLEHRLHHLQNQLVDIHEKIQRIEPLNLHGIETQLSELKNNLDADRSYSLGAAIINRCEEANRSLDTLNHRLDQVETALTNIELNTRRPSISERGHPSE